jgi:hypothetical protein
VARIRHPLLAALGLLALVLVAFGLFAPRPPPGQGEALQDLPWHVERDHEGNARVLGITLGRDRLALLAQRFGAPQGVGLFQSERGDSLEAYFPTIRTGRLEGRLVARLEAGPEQIEGYVARAVAAERTASGATRYTLGADDKAALGARRVVGVSYLPKYRGLDAAFFRERLGEPAAWLQPEEGTVLWFYPDRGLTLTLSAKEGAVLEYVPPGDFVLPADAATAR